MLQARGRRSSARFMLGVLAAFFAMLQLITILNRCPHFRGFVYQHARFSSDYKSVESALRPRKGSAAVEILNKTHNNP